MVYTALDIQMDEAFRKRLRIVGIFLVVLGLLGIVLPEVLSITLSMLIVALLIASGALTAYAAWNGYGRGGLAWLKPFVLITVGLLVAFYPLAGAAAIGLILIIYFLLDGFASIMLAFALRPMPGWGWTLFSGVASLVLALIFIGGWPFQAIWLVGLFIGISLLLDGIALLMLASTTSQTN